MGSCTFLCCCVTYPTSNSTSPPPPPIKGILYQLVLPFSPPADLQGTSPVPFFCNPFHFLEFIGLHYLPKQPKTNSPTPNFHSSCQPHPTNQPPFSFVLLSEYFFLQMQWILKLLNSVSYIIYICTYIHYTHCNLLAKLLCCDYINIRLYPQDQHCIVDTGFQK